MAPKYDPEVVKMVVACRKRILAKYERDFAERNKLVQKDVWGVMKYGGKRLKKRLLEAEEAQAEIRRALDLKTSKGQYLRLYKLYKSLETK